MRSSRCPLRVWLLRIIATLAAAVSTRHAGAEPLAQGFAVERYSPSAPDSGWLVMDELKLVGRLGAAVSFTSAYAYHPFVAMGHDGSTLNVVEHQAFANVGFAVFYDRYRFSLNLSDPLYASGQSGVLAGYEFRAPAVDPGKFPDKITDVRLGLDARVLGDASDPLRFGVSAQLWIPSGERALYATDGICRAVFRALAAGDLGMLSYAAYSGVHVRPLDESSVRGAPRGGELLAGVAAGSRLTLERNGSTVAVVGPELWGATALRDAFGKYSSSLEALLGIRLQHTTREGAHTVVKAGLGEALQAQFGAPEWRAVLTVESSDRFE